MANIDLNKPITVQIMNNTTVVKQYTFLADISCNGNPTSYLKYINRWGAWDYIYFQGRSDSELTTQYETYKYNPTNNFTYDTKTGTYHKAYTQGRIKIMLNTGWIDENFNPMIEDLLLSEYVLLDGTDPVVITDKSMKFKTLRFDKLINYTITAEKAYDEINNVI